MEYIANPIDLMFKFCYAKAKAKLLEGTCAH